MEVPGSPFGGCASSSVYSTSPVAAAAVSPRHPCGRHINSGLVNGGVGRRAGGDHHAMSLQEMEVQNGGGSSARKRLRVDAEQESEAQQLRQIIAIRGRNFIPIAASPTTFHTEEVRQNSETIYVPLTDDVLVNVRTAEQISYGVGLYFVGDHRGSYLKSSEGHVINLWRYREANEKLFVSRSFLFTNVMDFVRLKEILENI